MALDPTKIAWKQPKTTSHQQGRKHPRDCLDGGFPASFLKNRLLKRLVSGPFLGWTTGINDGSYVSSKNERNCWWTKSCTTKDDDYPIIYRVGKPSQVVVWDFFHQQNGSQKSPQKFGDHYSSIQGLSTVNVRDHSERWTTWLHHSFVKLHLKIQDPAKVSKGIYSYIHVKHPKG